MKVETVGIAGTGLIGPGGALEEESGRAFEPESLDLKDVTVGGYAGSSRHQDCSVAAFGQDGAYDIPARDVVEHE